MELKGEDALRVYAIENVSTETLVMEFLPKRAAWLQPAFVRESSMNIDSRTSDVGGKPMRISKFNLTYTAHPKAELPARVRGWEDGDIMDYYHSYFCSGITHLPKVIMYDRIRQCKYGEDEDGCSYSDEGCGDWLPSANRCFNAIFRKSVDLYSNTHRQYLPQHFVRKIMARLWPHWRNQKCTRMCLT